MTTAWVAFALLLAASAGWLVWWRTLRSMRDLSLSFNAMSAQLQAKISELEASRNQIEAILQGMSEGVLVIGPDGNIVLINEAARRILGVEPAAGMLSDAIRYPEILEMVGLIQQTGRPQGRQITLFSPDEERFLEVRASACDCGLPGKAALLVLHDITDLKKLEQVRREFVANVSHELKTPLTAIQGAVETLLEGALEDRQHNREFVASIAEENTRLRRIVDDLLALAQIESGPRAESREPVPLDPFLRSELERFAAIAKSAKVQLAYDGAGTGVTLQASRGELSQAVGNLLENAIKYNRPGGRVTLRAFASGRECRIEVEDTGIGIPEMDLPRIFERFYRVDKARSRQTGGTGLGLSIVKHVAESHGGSVSVESRPGEGSRFALLLPL